MTKHITRDEIMHLLDGQKPERSAWGRGVQAQARDMAEELPAEFDYDYLTFKQMVLNGAPDWSAYSYGGCALVYDGDIAGRYCTPSEQKRAKNGVRRPNRREEWPDVQARVFAGIPLAVLPDCVGVLTWRGHSS